MRLLVAVAALVLASYVPAPAQVLAPLPPDRAVEQLIEIIDSDHGELLATEKTVITFSVNGTLVKDCLFSAKLRAMALVPKYRKKRPFAFAHIDCHWIRTDGREASLSDQTGIVTHKG